MKPQNKPKRNLNGEGTIYYREDSKRWVTQVTIDGKRRSRSFKKQIEAQKWKFQQIAQSLGTATSSLYDMTLQQFLESWLERRKESISLSTYYGYKRSLKNHIDNEASQWKIKKINHLHIQQILDDCVAKAPEGKTNHRAHNVLRTMLHKAFEDAKQIGGPVINPVNGTVAMKQPPKESPTLSPADIIVLLSKLKGHYLHPIVFLTLATGMRLGEVLGLQWDAINYEYNQIYVHRQARYIPQEGVKIISSTKGRQGKKNSRVIKINIDDIRFLDNHSGNLELKKEALHHRWKENMPDLVFPSEVGTPLDPTNVSSLFTKKIRETNLPQITFHGLRHTHATQLLMNGINPKVAQERLGHGSITTTLGTYVHALPSMQEEAANAVGNFLSYEKIEAR